LDTELGAGDVAGVTDGDDGGLAGWVDEGVAGTGGDVVADCAGAEGVGVEAAVAGVTGDEPPVELKTPPT
jgi:hypothetical protein